MNPSVNWSELEHAYGPATDIPDLLEALKSVKSAERRKALDKLASRLNHQGWASPAAVHAVPELLVALRAAKSPGDSGRLLTFLGDLAVGGNHQSGMLAGYGQHWGSLSLAEPLDPKLWTAVHAELDLYRSLLRDRKPSVRSAAAFAIALLGPDEVSEDAVAAALASESEPLPLASMALCLGLLLQASGRADHLKSLTALLAHEEPLCQWAAACALVWCQPQAELLPVLLEGAKAAQSEKDLPFYDGNLSALCLLLATRLVIITEQLERLEDLLALRVPGAGPSLIVLLGHAILQPADHPPEEKKDRTQLNPLQVRFLRLCIELEESKKSNAVFQLHSVLRNAGLVCWPEPLKQLLNADADRVLERWVEGKPLWKHAYRAKDGVDPLSKWHDLVRQLEPSAQAELVRELAKIPYEMGRRAKDYAQTEPELFALILATIEEHSIKLDAFELAEQADPGFAAGFVAALVNDVELKAQWARDNVDWAGGQGPLLHRGAGTIPQAVLPLIELLPLDKREETVLNVHRWAGLALAACAPTPQVAEKVAFAAKTDNIARVLSREQWQTLLSKFQKDSLSVFEEAVANPKLNHLDLFVERIAQLKEP